MPLLASPPNETITEIEGRRPSLGVYRRCDTAAEWTRQLYTLVQRDIAKGQTSSAFLSEMARFAQLATELGEAIASPDDWDGYGAEAPLETVANEAKAFLTELHALHIAPVTILPSAEGGIAFYFTNADQTSFLEFRNSGDIAFVTYGPGVDPHTTNISQENLNSMIVTLLDNFLALRETR
jgi:hypothetical protein